MTTLGRACPSGRLQTTHFFPEAAGQFGQRVARSLFFGALTSAVSVQPPVDTKLVSLQQAFTPERTNPIFRVSPDNRLRADTFEKPGIDVVAQDSFFGRVVLREFIDVVPAPDDGIGTILIGRRVVVVTYGTVLVDVTSFAAGPWTLNVLRPSSFDAGGGTSANFGYGG